MASKVSSDYMRRQSICVFAATEESAANDLARSLIAGADAIDRLAQIERQVLRQTEDMPDYARAWFKLMDGECWWVNLHPTDGIQEGDAAPDLRPDEPGPLWLPIIDPSEDT